MDAIRFDALTRDWFAATSRRRTLAGLLAGVLGALGLSHAEDVGAAKSGKCKKKCGQCQFCKKGKCKKRKNGKKRCKKGTCKPEKRGTPCGGIDNCGCLRSVEGDTFCALIGKFGCDGCANSGECPFGSRCIRCGSTSATGCVQECGVL